MEIQTTLLNSKPIKLSKLKNHCHIRQLKDIFLNFPIIPYPIFEISFNYYYITHIKLNEELDLEITNSTTILFKNNELVTDSIEKIKDILWKFYIS